MDHHELRRITRISLLATALSVSGPLAYCADVSTHVMGKLKRTLSASTDTVSAGYYTAGSLSAVDADLAAANIVSTATIFGITGTLVITGTVTVPDTGQTTVYTSGDDASYNSPLLQKSYTDNGDGTIKDNITGLTWKKCSEPDTETGSCGGSHNTYTWTGAITQCEGLTYASQSDWRLPNIIEIFSLVKEQGGTPLIDGAYFPATVSGCYWASTTYGPSTTTAFSGAFDTGHAGTTAKSGSCYVRCVRPGRTRTYLTTTGAGSWSVPSNWNSSNNTIEVIGGGGSCRAVTNYVSPGGGGGGYSKSVNVALTPGSNVSYSVGAGGSAGNGGDTWFCNSNSNCADINGTAVVVGAKGGAMSPTNANGGLGGAAASGICTGADCVKYSGGDGGNALASGSYYDGGGGGAAGPYGNGGKGGNAWTGGSYGPGGGGGGGGGSAGVNGTSGTSNSAGGNNYLGFGGGAGRNGSNGDSGTAGGGGGSGGSYNGSSGGQGGTGTEWDSTHGSGGGGGGGIGGGGYIPSGGLYGGGGGGGYSGTYCRGAQGIIVLTTYGQ